MANTRQTNQSRNNTKNRANTRSANSSAARKKANTKRAQKLRRQRAIFAVVLVAIVLVAIFGIKAIIGNLAAIPEHSMLSIDGSKVIYEEVEDFSDSGYSKSDMKNFVRNQVKDYNTAAKEDVKIEKIKVKGDTAYVKLAFESDDSYFAFMQRGIFVGTIAEAKAAGYDFATVFTTVTEDGKGSVTTVTKATENENAKVVIINENTWVKVDGTIKFVSDMDTSVSGDVVSVTPADGNMDAAALTYIIYE